MRPSHLINGVVMVAVLGGGVAMSLYVLLTPELRTAITKPVPGYDYLDGKLTSSVEASYKDELPIKNRSVDVLNALTVSLFSEGRKGVVIGANGWLFTAEEYAWTPDSPKNLETNLTRIGEIAGELKTRGIALEIALIPEKADIYSDLLLRARPSEHTGEYDSVRERLVALTDAPVPDLRQLLLTERQKEDVFFPTDTHWTVAGAGAVASEVARSFPTSPSIAAVSFDLKPDAVVHHDGDLLRFVELGPFSHLLPKTQDTVAPKLAVAAAADVGAFLSDDSTAASSPHVALVGTSYSANTLWSFEPQLKAALGRDVVNLAEAGHGPMVPMEAFLKKLDAGEIHVSSVIWEMPLRYLDDKPDVVADGSSI